MPWMGFEPTIPAFERAVDQAATVIGPKAVCISLSLFPNIDEGRILGQLCSEHNLNMRIVPYRPEEYEFVACTMPTGSTTILEAVSLVLMFVFTFSNTALGQYTKFKHIPTYVWYFWTISLITKVSPGLAHT
jgi:hypothetical protein